MAPRAAPPERRCSEGSLAKPNPDAGASFLLPFQRLEKGVAREGETRNIRKTRQSAWLSMTWQHLMQSEPKDAWPAFTGSMEPTTQPCRHAAGVGGLPGALRAVGVAPAVIPAVVDALAVED